MPASNHRFSARIGHQISTQKSRAQSEGVSRRSINRMRYPRRSSWSSISRPPGPSAWPCGRRCSRGPPKWSSKPAACLHFELADIGGEQWKCRGVLPFVAWPRRTGYCRRIRFGKAKDGRLSNPEGIANPLLAALSSRPFIPFCRS